MRVSRDEKASVSSENRADFRGRVAKREKHVLGLRLRRFVRRHRVDQTLKHLDERICAVRGVPEGQLPIRVCFCVPAMRAPTLAKAEALLGFTEFPVLDMVLFLLLSPVNDREPW